MRKITLSFVAVLGATLVVAGLAIGINSGEGTPDPPNELRPGDVVNGRLAFPFVADVVFPEDKDSSEPQGYGVLRTCLVDAVVMVDGSRIESVKDSAPGSDVAGGQDVASLYPRAPGEPDGPRQIRVYRNDEGDLVEGCHPDSWELDQVLPSEP